MKKVLLSVFALGLLSLGQVSAQCTPGNINVDFQPANNSTLTSPTVGVPYSSTILFRAPSSLTLSVGDIPGLPQGFALAAGLAGVSSISVDVNSMLVNGITGQPAGLSGTASGSGTYSPNTQGCIEIAGTATESGNFTVTLDVKYNVSFNAGAINAALSSFGNVTVPQPVPNPQARTYNMSVPTGIEEVLSGNKFDVAAIAPNPFDVSTHIIFTTPQPGNVELNVYNMLGKLVYHNTYETKQGKNSVELYSDKLSSGMYIYSLSNGKEVRTGKMTVSK